MKLLLFCSELRMSDNKIYTSPRSQTDLTISVLYIFFSVLTKGSFITLTSVKLENIDELFLLILSATITWEQAKWEGNAKKEDTGTTFKIRYEVICGTTTSFKLSHSKE